MSGSMRSLPPKPRRRTLHATSLPKLQQPLWLLDLQPIRVIAMDANVLLDLTESCLSATGAECSALLEQLHAGRLRVIISHQDVEPVASMLDPEVVIERIERSMEKRVKFDPRRSAALQSAWRTHLRPWMHVLNPVGCSVSDVHTDVMRRDPDDADLGLLAVMLGVDAFLSRDSLAFSPTFLPVLPSVQRQEGDQSQPGVLDILAAWRNECRVQQHTNMLALPPVLVAVGVKEGVWALSRAVRVPPLMLLPAAAALGAGLFFLLPPALKVAVQRGLQGYLNYTMEVQQTPEEKAYDSALRALCELTESEPATDFRVIAARHLSRARRPVPVGTLAELGGVTARTAGMRLRKHPGLFREWVGGLWSLVPCLAELELT